MQPFLLPGPFEIRKKRALGPAEETLFLPTSHFQHLSVVPFCESFLNSMVRRTVEVNGPAANSPISIIVTLF